MKKLIILGSIFSTLSFGQSLQQEFQSQNKNQISTSEILRVSDVVMKCSGVDVYAIKNNIVTFYMVAGGNPQSTGLDKRNPSFIEPVKFDPNKNSFEWKLNGDLMGRKVTNQQALLINEKKLYTKLSINNQVVEFPCERLK